MVDAMVESGMVAAGYTLLSTVCTGWQARDPVTHELQENLTNWPGGKHATASLLLLLYPGTSLPYRCVSTRGFCSLFAD